MSTQPTISTQAAQPTQPTQQTQPSQSPHRRGPWSSSEDALLLNCIHHSSSLNWVHIAHMLGSRTPKQCRERYHQNLKPTLNHDPITPEEGAMIERLVNEYGHRWADIARRLNGRSDNAVKNWWNGSQNRRKRQDRCQGQGQLCQGLGQLCQSQRRQGQYRQDQQQFSRRRRHRHWCEPGNPSKTTDASESRPRLCP